MQLETAAAPMNRSRREEMCHSDVSSKIENDTGVESHAFHSTKSAF